MLESGRVKKIREAVNEYRLAYKDLTRVDVGTGIIRAALVDAQQKLDKAGTRLSEAERAVHGFEDSIENVDDMKEFRTLVAEGTEGLFLFLNDDEVPVRITWTSDIVLEVPAKRVRKKRTTTAKPKAEDDATEDAG